MGARWATYNVVFRLPSASLACWPAARCSLPAACCCCCCLSPGCTVVSVSWFVVVAASALTGPSAARRPRFSLGSRPAPSYLRAPVSPSLHPFFFTYYVLGRAVVTRRQVSLLGGSDPLTPLGRRLPQTLVASRNSSVTSPNALDRSHLAVVSAAASTPYGVCLRRT